MLGYVKACKSEMKVRDYEIYRGVYCSLCRSLGRNYSVFARLLLSYDFAFAAILRLSLAARSCTFTRGRCPFNPSKRCFYCGQREEIDFCAHAVIITAYYKLLDNIHDRETGKKILSALCFPAIALMHRKAKRLAPETEAIVAESIKKQTAAEKKENTGIDEAADASAEALGRICALGYEGEIKAAVYDTGYLLGRMVYIMDCADDLEKDIKSGNFNPLKKAFPSLETREEKDAFASYIEKVFNSTHAALLDSKDELPLKRFGEITENILFGGIEVSRSRIMNKYRPCGADEKSFTVE